MLPPSKVYHRSAGAGFHLAQPSTSSTSTATKVDSGLRSMQGRTTAEEERLGKAGKVDENLPVQSKHFLWLDNLGGN